ncbi:MAG: IclR family transcriptional regulator [Thermodesulfobacteriota bacterium]
MDRSPMNAQTKEMGRHVEAVLRALDLLDCFQHKPVLTLKEMAARTRMTRSRVIRLAGTLASRGYLIYNAQEKQFQLGSRLLGLGKVFELNNTLTSLARPFLKELVQETGELASLYVIDGMERVALVREKGIHEISYSVGEGQRMELYAGAAGKALLAFAPPDVQTAILSRKILKRLTSRTITDPDRLAEELEEIRRKGYACSGGERVSDVWSVAAPVFDHTKQVCCSIGVTGPLFRIPKRLQLRYTKILTDKAGKLSDRLGWYES